MPDQESKTIKTKAMAKTGIIVIDPGHGGKAEVGGSSANNATSVSGVLEKNITLRMAFQLRDQLTQLAQNEGHNLKVILTRESDVNLGLSARAEVAKKSSADLFLSIHCNAFNGKARGPETLISPVTAGNTNHAADKQYATIIQTAVFKTISAHDPKTIDRGVKDQQLGVLRDTSLGTKTRGCLVELEFIDVKAVDELLNIGPKAPQVRNDIASALAKALVKAL
jgi:N-acetylmuramoyl-L-alanine amidase